MLGVGEPVGKIRMGAAHHDVAQRVVDVATSRNQAGVLDDLAGTMEMGRVSQLSQEYRSRESPDSRDTEQVRGCRNLLEQALDLLIRYLGSGDQAAFDSAAALWRSNTAPVDFVMGFSDIRFDPLRRKGLWTALLFLPDTEAQGRVDKLLGILPELTASLPGGPPGTRSRPRCSSARAGYVVVTVLADAPIRN